MPVLVLQTKLYIPRARPDAIQRQDLHRRLDDGLERGRRLTVVAAPAGSGKTTLISDWVSGLDRPAAWLSLDEADNDAVRWSAHLVSAVRSVAPDVGEALLAMLDATPPPPPDAIVTSLINEIIRKAPPFVLVLDDYHVIGRDEIHHALELLIEHMPPTMHLVLLTRSEPPLPLARLRARDQITELRGEDLRFSGAEVAEFLNERMGLDLGAEELNTLEARTEGWIAGLQLAALSLRGESDVEGFIETFAGSDRFVLDYLVEEVLAKQPASTQTFLLRTSVLDRLNGSLCDAVTGRDDGRAMLEKLDDENLFIVPLDHRQGWYRYHRLFADLLRHRLRVERPDAPAELHLRASAWFEDQGELSEAIEHAMAAERWDRAADLIERTMERWDEREVSLLRLLSWCDQLPEDELRARPSLNVHHAWLLADAAEFSAAEAKLADLAEQADARVPHLACKTAAIRSQIALSQGRMDDAVAQARMAITCLPDDPPPLWNDIAVTSLVYGALLLGDLELADEALQRLPPLDQRPTTLRLITNALAGFLLMMKGQHQEAAEQFRYTMDRAVLDGPARRPHPLSGLAQVGLGQAQLAWNQLDEAEQNVERGLHLAEKSHNSTALGQGFRALMHLRWAQGDREGLAAAIQRAEQHVRALRASGLWMAELMGAHVKQTQALAGMWDDVRPWLDAYRRRRPDLPPTGDREMAYMDQLQELAFVRALMAVALHDGDRSMLREAAEDVDRVIAAAERSQHHNVLLQAWVYRALLHRLLDDEERARAALLRALELAAPAGIVRPFLDEGEPMRRLLASIVARDDAPAYADVVLAEFPDARAPGERPPFAIGLPGGLVPDRPIGASRAQVQVDDVSVELANRQLLEPLTDRELDVLELIAQGMTNQEIADELVVTVGTVKSHAKHIYGKLDVGNRTEAAARARELGLLT